MQTQTLHVRSETPAEYALPAAESAESEDAIIARAIEIVTRRMFTRGDRLADPSVAKQFCALRLARHPNEVFAVAFLDTQLRLIAFEEMFRGSIDSTEVHPRELVRRALALNAAAVILAHNHPSGVAKPSRADQLITGRIRDALGLIGVRVVDHLVIGETVSSMGELGML